MSRECSAWPFVWPFKCDWPFCKRPFCGSTFSRSACSRNARLHVRNVCYRPDTHCVLNFCRVGHLQMLSWTAQTRRASQNVTW